MNVRAKTLYDTKPDNVQWDKVQCTKGEDANGGGHADKMHDDAIGAADDIRLQYEEEDYMPDKIRRKRRKRF